MSSRGIYLALPLHFQYLQRVSLIIFCLFAPPISLGSTKNRDSTLKMASAIGGQLLDADRCPIRQIG
ncbi:hypothetical protein BDZ91DRAFT_442592 [Kalaharituber pfeilii]|nr:hypothetical protein BDZ91DRAFT_442592 [Kalaharituber pfeilii]